MQEGKNLIIKVLASASLISPIKQYHEDGAVLDLRS